MLHIAVSNRFMDCHKYPKSRTSIRIQQPEILDSIKCHTFPGMGGKTLDILLHDSTLQFFFVPKVLIEMPAHTYSFIVIPARLVHARARLICIRPLQLDAWPKANRDITGSDRRAAGLLARARLSDYPVRAQ